MALLLKKLVQTLLVRLVKIFHQEDLLPEPQAENIIHTFTEVKSVFYWILMEAMMIWVKILQCILLHQNLKHLMNLVYLKILLMLKKGSRLKRPRKLESLKRCWIKLQQEQL